MNNRCISLLLAVVSAASLYGTTFHRSFSNGYPSEARSATVKSKSNPLGQPAKGAKPSQGGAVGDSAWQSGPDRLWFVNWNKAVEEAKKTKKKLFVLNTGSDWCGWCMRLRAEVLGSNKFKAYARKNLVLVYLDSPKKKPLPDDQQQHNRDVASRLNFGGGVPCAKIVDPDGEQVLETISGYRPEEEYLKLVKDAVGK